MKSGLPAIMTLIGFCCLGLTVSAATDIAADSTDVLRHALSAGEKRQGPTNPSLLPAIDKLAQARWRDGDLGETATLRRRALDIAVGAFGSGSAKAAAAMTALAQIDLDRRRYLDAEGLLLAAASVLSDAAAPDQSALAKVFAGLARIAVARGSLDDGQDWAEQAGVKDPQATQPLLAMAALRAAQERFADSKKLIEQALARDRERYGPEGTAVARGLSQLGNLYLRQQRYDEALPSLEQAAAIDRQALAPAHPFIADDFYDLGLTYDGLKRAGQARRSLAFAVELLQHGSEKNSLRLAYAERELARVLRAAGKGEEADALSKDSKRILDKAEDDERDRERQI